jgi:hypothetical protein
MTELFDEEKKFDPNFQDQIKETLFKLMEKSNPKSRDVGVLISIIGSAITRDKLYTYYLHCIGGNSPDIALDKVISLIDKVESSIYDDYSNL